MESLVSISSVHFYGPQFSTSYICYMFDVHISIFYGRCIPIISCEIWCAKPPSLNNGRKLPFRKSQTVNFKNTTLIKDIFLQSLYPKINGRIFYERDRLGDRSLQT